jgi:DNA repair exonuclease SbcCD ATPase subunit
MSSDIRNSNENAAINIHNQIPHNLNNAQSTLRAPSSPTSTPAIDRLMGDREQRLTETRKKLALWEENLTLAQVDQDRQRKEVQERMKEVNLVKDQWKKSRETLKVERRQMDVLSKSLKNRESAISARERQTTFMEEQLKERQTKMEQAAIAMAEKKILKEYNEKNERLIKKEKELEIKEKKWREKLLKEQCVLTEMQEKLNSNLKKYEGDRYKLDGILEKKKLEMNRINEKCQKNVNDVSK